MGSGLISAHKTDRKEYDDLRKASVLRDVPKISSFRQGVDSVTPSRLKRSVVLWCDALWTALVVVNNPLE